MASKRIIVTSALIIISFALAACSSDDKTSESTSTSKSTTTKSTPPPVQPELETSVLFDGLSKPWDIAFIDKQTFLFTEKSGSIKVVKKNELSELAKISDVKDAGEGGLLGLAIDTDFDTNRFIYVCFNSKKASDIRVARYEVDQNVTKIQNEKIIVTGINSKESGRHSGCRIKSANDGNLFVGTGDAANANTPQNPKSLSGKILRIDREGKGVQGNLGEPFDNRIFNYGHRNVQGIALFDKPTDGVYGFSAEHGPDIDDEVNLIRSGNFGWAPTGSYNESVPMTDTRKFPDAISAVWSSGDPTIAPSGATLISGEKWGTYNGALALAVLKGSKVKILKFDRDYSISFDVDVLKDFGRIRSIVQGPDGNLYFVTDDSSDGKIVKVTPSISS